MKKLFALIAFLCAPLLVAATVYTYPPNPAPKYFTWQGQTWSNNSGQVLSANVPYAYGYTADHLRFEVHDTVYDRGPGDPTTKRRSEIHEKVGLKNGVVYWDAFTFVDQPWTCPACQAKAGSVAGAVNQIHMPSGGSPAIAFRRMGDGQFGVTTNPGGNVKRFKMPLSFGVAHDIVYRFKLAPSGATTGTLTVWVDGVKKLDMANFALGGTGDGYYRCLGAYYASGLLGNQIVQEYYNVAKQPLTTDLSSRILNP